jgi:ATP-dependent Clp protease adaptor protein ClpS
MAVETPIAPERAVEGQSKIRLDPGWNVMLWDDPVNLISYVMLVLRKLFGHDHETAARLTMQVHNEGKAIVATQPREQAEISVAHLHAFGLQATLARP